MNNHFAELRQFLTVLLRGWWILLLAAVMAGIVGFGVSSRQPAVYEATTSVLVGRSIKAVELERADLQVSQLLALTYADIVHRQPVLQGVVTALSLDESWDSLRQRVKVRPVDQTQILEITASAPSPKEARIIADEVARQLISISPTALQAQSEGEMRAFVDQRIENLRSHIEAGHQRLDSLATELAEGYSQNTDPSRNIQEEIRELEKAITSWDDTFSQLLIYRDRRQSSNYLALVEPAQAKSAPVSPRVEFNTILAALVGLVVAMGFIFLLEYLDDTLKTANDVEQVMGVAPLGIIGQLKNRIIKGEQAVPLEASTFLSEEYRLLRSKIQFTFADRPNRVMMVTSPSHGDSKKITVANLGIVMAEAGLNVIIVDADLRNPTQHALFQLPNNYGLTDLLDSPTLALDAYLKRTEWLNLRVLTAGTTTEYPSEMLGSARLKQRLDEMASTADIVLCNSSEAAVVADASVLARQVEGVLLVIEAGKTSRRAVQQTIENLQLANTTLLGTVFDLKPQKNRVFVKGASAGKQAINIVSRTKKRVPNQIPANETQPPVEPSATVLLRS